MEKAVEEIPADELITLLLRASLSSEALAAGSRLAAQVDEVRTWLARQGYIKLASSDGGAHYATIDFTAALAELPGFRRDPRQSPLSRSAIDVIAFAGSLAGSGSVTLRSSCNFDETSVKYVAEAIMYAAGFMDGAADPTANDPGDGGLNSRAHDALLEELF